MIATGDNSHVMFIEWHTVCDGSIDIPKYVDKVDGPGLRSKERIVAGAINRRDWKFPACAWFASSTTRRAALRKAPPQ